MPCTRSRLHGGLLGSGLPPLPGLGVGWRRIRPVAATIRRHGLNRAAALRIAACGLMGLGAALLIAAILLATYTSSKVAKIPLTIDTTLVSDGTGTAFDPASLTQEKFVIDKNAPLVKQQQVSVETPANADVITLQVGSTLRRTDKQKDNGLLLALVDTVTMDRRTAMSVS